MPNSSDVRPRRQIGQDVLLLLMVTLVVWSLDAFNDHVIMGEASSLRESFFAPEPWCIAFRIASSLALFVVLLYARGASSARVRELEARNEAEERFRRAFEDSAVGMATSSLDGRILHANQAFCWMIGYPWEELVGMALSDISVPRDLEINNRLRQRLLDGEISSFQMEKDYITKNGALFSGLLGVSLIRDAQGRPLHFLAQIQDVTERKHAAALLAESEDKLRTISESAHDGIVMLDDKGIITFWNPAAEKIFGYTSEEVVGRDAHLMLLGSEQLDKYREGFSKFSASGAGPVVGRTMKLDGRRKNGEAVPVELSISGVQVEGVWHAVGIVRDISKRLHEEYQLRESEARFRSIFENSPLGMSLLTTGNDYLDVNESFTKMFGYSREESQSLNVADVSTDEGMTVNMDLRNEAIAAGVDRYQLEKQYRRKDGTLFWGKIFGSIVRDENGDPAYVIGMTEDITDARRVRELGDTLDGLNLLISSNLDVHSVLPEVIAGSAQVLNADEGIVLACNDGVWSVSAQSGTSSRGTLVPDAQVEVEAFDFLNSIAGSAEPLLITPVDDPKSTAFFHIAEGEVERCLFAPLRARDEVLGAVCFFRSDERMECGDAERGFVTRLAVSLSLALENARMYDAERRIADTLQEAVLSVPQDIANIDFGHLYKSATESAKIGGDFYDLFELEEGKVGILLGDVSGKGLDAAALTSLVKNTIRAYAQQERSPATVVAKTNDLMLKTSMSAAFVTLIFGVLDKRTRTFAYCNAGHPSAMVKHSGGVRQLEEGICPAIGIAPGVAFEVRREQLGRGETLLLYTDGVTEARNGDDFFGYNGLTEALKEANGGPAQSTADMVYDAVIGFSESKLMDDLAIAAVMLHD